MQQKILFFSTGSNLRPYLHTKVKVQAAYSDAIFGSHDVKKIHIRSYSGPHFSHIFPHSDWIRRDTPYLSVFSPNSGKCGKNGDQNNSEYGLFLRSEHLHKHDYCSKVFKKQRSNFVIFSNVPLKTIYDNSSHSDQCK